MVEDLRRLDDLRVSEAVEVGHETAVVGDLEARADVRRLFHDELQLYDRRGATVRVRVVENVTDGVLPILLAAHSRYDFRGI